MTLYVEMRRSEKTGKEYLALMCEKDGNKPKIITLDCLAIYKLCGKKRADFALGDRYYIVSTNPYK